MTNCIMHFRQAVANTKRPAGSSAPPGLAVVRALQDCLYGPELRSLPFVKLVLSQSYEQVSCPYRSSLPTRCMPLALASLGRGAAPDGCACLSQALQAQRACAGLLVAALSPANCFSLLALGHAHRLRSLEAHAQGLALEDFTEAMALDRAGFCSLPEQVSAFSLPFSRQAAHACQHSPLCGTPSHAEC